MSHYSSSRSKKRHSLLQSTEGFLTARPNRQRMKKAAAVQEPHSLVIHLAPIKEKEFQK